MRPTLFSIHDVPLLGDLYFHAYTVMMAIAFVACTLLAVRENYKLEKPFPITPIAGIWIALAGRVGAHAWWILQYRNQYEPLWGKEIYLYESFFIWQPGLVYYGGLAGGLAAAIAYMKFKRVPLLPIGDVCMPYLMLGIAITRVGCFLNGCCWGRVTHMPWGIVFPRGSYAFKAHVADHLIDASAPASLPVHPTQIYNAAGLLLLFFLMRHAYKKPHPVRSILFLYPLLYGALRFSTEALRGDSPRPYLGMTLSQVVSLGLIAFAALAYLYLYLFRWRTSKGDG